MKRPTPSELYLARYAAGLTQRKAGAVVGYSERGWQDAEAGRRQMPWHVWMLFRARVAALARDGRKACRILRESK